jgi:hypothetical protein
LLRCASACESARGSPARAGRSAAASRSRWARRGDGPVVLGARRRAVDEAPPPAPLPALAPRDGGEHPHRLRDLPLLGLEEGLDPREVGAEGDRLALAARPARAPGQREEGRLEQIRLPRPVGPVEHGQVRRERHLAVGEVAEPERVDPRDPQGIGARPSVGSASRGRRSPRSRPAAGVRGATAK